jgi:hypothetical protein
MARSNSFSLSAADHLFSSAMISMTRGRASMVASTLRNERRERRAMKSVAWRANLEWSGSATSRFHRTMRRKYALEAASVANLGLDDRVRRCEPDTVQRPAGACRGGERTDCPGAVSVVFREVLRNLGLETKLLNKLDEHELGPAVGTEELDLLRLRGTVRPKLELGDGAVDRLLRHGTVRRPLATSNGKETRGRDVLKKMGRLVAAEERIIETGDQKATHDHI